MFDFNSGSNFDFGDFSRGPVIPEGMHFSPGSVIDHGNGWTTSTDPGGFSITHMTPIEIPKPDLVSMFDLIPFHDPVSVINEPVMWTDSELEKIVKFHKVTKETPTKKYDWKNSELTPATKLTIFAMNYPEAAFAIGPYIRYSTNISTNAARFASQGDEDLGGLGDKDDGNRQTNAFRHGMWQGAITARFGAEVAERVGYANEINPNVDLNIRHFTDALEADQTVDLLNNQIGRKVGLNANTTSMKELAFKLLDYYHEEGLYTALKKNGGYEVEQVKLSDHQYNYMQDVFEGLDENGKSLQFEYYNPILSNPHHFSFGNVIYDKDKLEREDSLENAMWEMNLERSGRV